MISWTTRPDAFDKAITAIIATKFLALDTETNGQDVRDGRGHCIGISVAGTVMLSGLTYSFYFPIAHTEGNITEEMKKRLFEAIALGRDNKNRALLMHNAKYDLASLKTVGLDFQGYYYCTQVCAHLVNENWYSKELDKLGLMLLGRTKEKSPAWDYYHKRYGWSGQANMPVEVMWDYATTDAELTEELFLQHLLPALVDKGYVDLEES